MALWSWLQAWVRPSPHLVVVALDIETTGLDPRGCDVLEVGWAVVEGGGSSGSARLRASRSVLVEQPLRGLNLVEDHPLVHENIARWEAGPRVPMGRIVHAFVREVRQACVAGVASGRAAQPYLVVHSLAFEATFLADQWSRITEPFGRRVVCTKSLLEPMRLSGRLRSTSLESAVQALATGGAPDHTAQADAEATALLGHALLTGRIR